jgi:hypothetical protein
MAVKIQVEVFWVVTPCSVVVGYRRFGGPCCIHLCCRVICMHCTHSSLLISLSLYILNVHHSSQKSPQFDQVLRCFNVTFLSLLNLYSSANIIKVIKSRKMK